MSYSRLEHKIDGQQTKAKQIARKKAEENKQKPKSIELTGLRTKAKSVSGADSIAAYTSNPTEHIPIPRPKKQKAKKKPSKKRTSKAYNRAVEARKAYDRAAETIESDPSGPEHLYFNDDVNWVTDVGQSLLDWLERVQEYMDPKMHNRLHILGTRIMDETVTLAELRDLEPMVDDAEDQLREVLESLEMKAEELEILLEND